MSSPAFQEFRLRNGTTLANRIVKAAMEENMADVNNCNQPSDQLISLYRAWGEGGAGLILSGHVMIDATAMACPGDLLLAEDFDTLDEKRWRALSTAGKQGGAQFWLQINHPGRQAKAGSGIPSYAPSPVAVDIGRLSSAFTKPLALSEEQIQDVVRRFVWTARKASELGFDGIEIHAAHGYLLSQFLSPLSNKREDSWGGSLENRARLLLTVVKEVRAVVPPKFGIGVKINSSDFQRGGFAETDLHWVAKQLDAMNIDVLEISGGSMESPAMRGVFKKEHTQNTAKREAYFLDVAEDLKKNVDTALLITGGIRTRQTLDRVVDSSDRILAGVGTALGLMPDLPKRWERGEDPVPDVSDCWFFSGPILAAANTAAVECNMRRVGNGQQPWIGIWPTFALIWSNIIQIGQMRAYRAWIHKNKIV